ncbi:MAG: radical SAM protein [Planctomycetota bacterium]|nr:MAG: radical SAM protein [Planctomycetota bacterium]
MDYQRSPFVILWEITRACDLACRHCRADAQQRRHSDELRTDECTALLDHMRAEFGPVLVVFTGGDPLLRDDLEELVTHAKGLGLRPTLTPSATPLLTRARMDSLVAAGIQRFAVSVDGADAATQDGFRRVPGTFATTVAALEYMKDCGYPLQINSSIGVHNRHQLRDLAALAQWFSAALWSVFILVPTGRAQADDLLSAVEHERLYRELADIAAETSMDIKTTAGQPYYRVQAQRGRNARAGMRAAGPVNDGKGVVFISHRGEVQPSGFLPEICGNVRDTPLAEIYRSHPLFRALRNPDALGGKCGRCEYRSLCGGSRARAYGLTGDALAADPTCVYQPKGLALEVAD